MIEKSEIRIIENLRTISEIAFLLNESQLTTTITSLKSHSVKYTVSRIVDTEIETRKGI
jgi:hypothetical protein